MIGKQTEPDRYAGDGVSCSQAMNSMMRASKVTDSAVIWWWGSAFKYLWRWWAKGGKDDLDKAIDCLERLKGEIDGQR